MQPRPLSLWLKVRYAVLLLLVLLIAVQVARGVWPRRYLLAVLGTLCLSLAGVRPRLALVLTGLGLALLVWAVVTLCWPITSSAEEMRAAHAHGPPISDG
jgi:hypothetical protein